MRYYIIAGEASGDLHGSNLIKAIRAEDPQAEIRAWGGDLMEQEGATLVKHYRDLAFMGFIEVAKNLRTILRNIEFCKEDVLAFEADVLILVDYPGFNLRIAKWAKPKGLRIFYYISPQIWAWNAKRVHGIKANVDRMFVILPFESDFYQQYNYSVDFVGHPLLDVIDQFPENTNFRRDHQLDDRPIIALLPGSRRQEIERMLEIMLQVVPAFTDYQFVIGGAPAIPPNFYQQLIQKSSSASTAVKMVHNQTYQLLKEATAALVTSGTATLETALFGVPEIVCYKGNTLSYMLARQLVKVKYISLVNLILDRPLLKELIQNELTPAKLEQELNLLLSPERLQVLEEGYAELRSRLGHSGASQKTAKLMVEALKGA